MADLSRAQITQLATNAGFSGSAVDTAVAIAFAESGGNPNAHNTKGKDDSYGLWQINMKGDLGPSRRKDFGLKADSDLLDPQTNARVAFGIYKRSGFNPWTTYTSNDYKKHLTDTGGSGGSAATGNTAAASTGTGLLGGINALGETLFKSFANIAGIIVAVVLLILGVVLLARNVLPISKVSKIAGKVLK